MKVEYTKFLTSGNWQDFRIALNERADNLLVESPSRKQKMILERIETNPDSFLGLQDYILLTEMAALTRKLWASNATLNIYFFGGHDSRTDKVFNIASEWTNYCNIKFKQVDQIDESQVRISFSEPGSWSYIGTDSIGIPKNKPTVNFGWLNVGLPESEYRQVVLHEFGHVLGLIHEHQNPSTSIKWNKSIVYWFCKFYFGWSNQETDNNIIQEFEKTQTKYTSVDKDSIMAYTIPPEFTMDGTTFPTNYEL
jgi:hypothetical protein